MGFPGIAIIGEKLGEKAHGGTLLPRPEVLERNLTLLRIRSEAAAEAIARTDPSAVVRAGIELVLAPDGGLTGTLPGADGRGRRLASARGPLAEGEALAGQVDLVLAAAVVVRGFGCGHHVAALCRRLGEHGCAVVLETDVVLLRGVLERVDCSAWLAAGNLVLITDPEDTAALSRGLAGLEALVSCGTRVVDHPPSMGRLGEATSVFARSVEAVVRAVRTNVVTTLVQMDVTVRNLLQNLRWYAFCPGVAELAGLMRGRAAVVVSAGPSLARNIELLSRPGVRDRVVIIAVQTVLKTLLDRGVRPHFVTALDYHEISRRFYEGLTREDVEGVTLVVEPKANPAILAAFPGEIRCAGDDVLERVLGDVLARETGDKGKLQPGATVAHLSYYLARHLGCDPVVLIGQDLGFTDHQYYAPGAAIHRVWGCELGEFRTLEMLEWERIARMRSLLRKVEAQGGGHIYTDEQMATYLVQFERDFTRDRSLGLTTIDATEGGVRKRATHEATLRSALADAGADPDGSQSAPMLPPIARAARRDDAALAGRVEARLREMIRSARRVQMASRDAAAILERMRGMISDGAEQGRVDRLVLEVQSIAERASKEPAYWLVQHINQTGQLNRFKADRAIEVEGAAGVQRQARQVERDLKNVAWLGEASDHSAQLLEQALDAFTTGRLRTRDQTVPPSHARDTSGEHRGTTERESTRSHKSADADIEINRGAVTITGTIVLEPGWDRAVCGQSLLERTGSRLITGMGGGAATRANTATNAITAIGAESDIARAAVMLRARGGPLATIAFQHVDGAALAARRDAVEAARLWSRHAWRGGIANLTCYDALVYPALMSTLADRDGRGSDGLLIVGSSWGLLDPALTADVLDRARGEAGKALSVAFSQAVPGLSPLALSTSTLHDLAAGTGPFATVGAMLGYIPVAPQSDPIAKGVCVQADAALRDAGWSVCASDERDATIMERVLRAERSDQLSASHIAAAWGEAARSLGAEALVEHVIIGAGASEPDLREMERLISASTSHGTRVAVTIRASRGIDPLQSANGDEAHFVRIATRARAAGAAGVHVRTKLSSGDEGARTLLSHVANSPRESLVSVVSIDVASNDDATFASLEGWDGAAVVRGGIEHLLEHRGTAPGSGGLPRLWVVPRIGRRDEVLDQLESFYDRWLLLAGAAMIDPPEQWHAGRLRALPRPRGVETLELLRTRAIGMDDADRERTP